MMSRLYHQNQPMQQGQQMQQQPQGLGSMIGQMQQQMGVAPRPQMQTQGRSPYATGRSPYNAGGSGAMNAIIHQLMQRKGF